MKKIFIISIFYLFSTNILIADEYKCSGMKKLSKEYLACTAKNIKESAVKKKDQVKEGSIKKTNQIKEGTKKIFNKVKTKIKKN
ncbi:hypothetical protein [Candidatus Pelagibacter sp.]|uniref:hypothetical protein n=1 Tax=Candidatus Pelagibacter sp. TaxID=2024849 RepID=UPI003F85E4B5